MAGLKIVNAISSNKLVNNLGLLDWVCYDDKSTAHVTVGIDDEILRYVVGAAVEIIIHVEYRTRFPTPLGEIIRMAVYPAFRNLLGIVERDYNRRQIIAAVLVEDLL